jgi:hypothetical protein
MAFQLFSLVFLHVIFSLVDGYSSLNANTFLNIVENNLGLILLSFINIGLIFYVKKLSRFILMLTSATLSIICFLLFLESFNKTILLYNVLYIIVSFFFCMIWKLELEEASYNSFYDRRLLRPIGLSNANVSLKQVEGEKSFSATISNWTEETCFLVTDSDLKLRGEVLVEIDYMNVHFQFEASVITASTDGIGLRVLKEKKGSSLNWFDFYDIILDRGITPNIL